MKPIAIFYHCLFFNGNPPRPLPAAGPIIGEQMALLHASGLSVEATEIHVGLNGGSESENSAASLLPGKCQVRFHGLDMHNENGTIVMLEEWIASHPDWHVLYFHSKGATKPVGDGFTGRWRSCMTNTVIKNWRQCVSDLEAGYDAVGVHWMVPPQTPPGQHIFAGTFFWAASNYLRTLPSIKDRDRIKVSGLGSPESRYEAEVWIGNGPRLPKVKDYHPNWNPSKISTCQP